MQEKLLVQHVLICVKRQTMPRREESGKHKAKSVSGGVLCKYMHYSGVNMKRINLNVGVLVKTKYFKGIPVKRKRKKRAHAHTLGFKVSTVTEAVTSDPMEKEED